MLTLRRSRKFEDFANFMFHTLVFVYIVKDLRIVTAQICVQVTFRYSFTIFERNKRHSIKTVSSKDHVIDFD